MSGPSASALSTRSREAVRGLALLIALSSVESDAVVIEEAISSCSDSSELFPVGSGDSGVDSIEKYGSGPLGDCG